VLSLVGDTLTVVQREMSTGTRIDRNTRTRVDLNSAALDNAVVLAIDRELARIEPGTAPVLLAARKPELFAIQSRALDEGGGLQKVVDALRDVVAPAKATHLVLATKHRADARLKLEDGYIGTGQIEGLGFYVDPTMAITRRETGQRSEGFIAPYAYFKISLVELPAGRILAQSVVMETDSAASQASISPWQTLSAEEKVRMLDALIRTGTARAVPQVIKQG
jgi:hypothetical protein